jgi:hypothetical protein
MLMRETILLSVILVRAVPKLLVEDLEDEI